MQPRVWAGNLRAPGLRFASCFAHNERRAGRLCAQAWAAVLPRPAVVGPGTACPYPVNSNMLPAKQVHGYRLEEVEQRLRSSSGIDGVEKQDLPTPALLVDLDRFEANVARMADYAAGASVGLRPHAKTHKCPEIAKRQIEAGALGVCTATIREAEAMGAAGVGGLLITSELLGPNKIHKLLRLTNRQPDTMSVVDSLLHAEQLSEAAVAAKTNLHVLIDIDPGDRRTGTLPGLPAVELAKKLDSLPNLSLRGVHSYSGSTSHVIGFGARKRHSEEHMEPVLDTMREMKKVGLPIEIMSGGSTGTYNIDPHLNGLTELQVGSYVFMDADYRRIGGERSALYDDFEPSLTVLATVISKNRWHWVTLDAGTKALAAGEFDAEVVGLTEVTYHFAGDEHGMLELESPNQAIRLGNKIELIIPHCDPSVNLYERIYACRGERVEQIWPISARGYG